MVVEICSAGCGYRTLADVALGYDRVNPEKDGEEGTRRMREGNFSPPSVWEGLRVE